MLSIGTCFSQSQNIEIGVAGGGSFFTAKNVTNQRGEADATFASSFGLSVWVGNDMHDHLSGEGRYTYGANNPKLEGAGQTASFPGDSHTLEYDLLIHPRARGVKVRPYFLVGGGGRYFRGKGPEQPVQPLQDFAILTKTSQWVGTISAGGGVMVQLKPRLVFRVELKDSMSPAPTKVIQPVPGASLEGWMHNFMPMIGFGYRF